MIHMLVVPDKLVEAVKNEDISMTIFNSFDQMKAHLSLRDLAEITLEMRHFPYGDLHKNAFRSDEAIFAFQLCEDPLIAMSRESEEKAHDLARTCEALTIESEVDYTATTGVYTLYPVKDALWVAGVQRQTPKEGDPQRRSLTDNRPFFDGLVAQALQRVPFKDAASTVLFTHYLKTLKKAAA